MWSFAFLLVFAASVRASYYSMHTIIEETASGNNFQGVWIDSLGVTYFSKSKKQVVQVLTPAGDTSLIIGPNAQSVLGASASATSVQLDGVDSIVGDTSGNLYISSGMYFIWKYDHSSGIVSRFAGTTPASQSFSGDGGQAIAANLNNPQGLFLSSNGHLFVADSSNNRVRTINTATGIINTFAGNGVQTFAGDLGPATTASLYSPTSVWGSSDGVMYIADSGNNRIRQVDMSGIITTFAGNGNSGYYGDNIPATSAAISPFAVIGDSNGNIFFADSMLDHVRMVKSGRISTIGGNGHAGKVSHILQSAPQAKGITLNPTSGSIYFTSKGRVNVLISDLSVAKPTKAPTKAPTNIPTFVPTITPTFVPTITPTIAPTTVATIGPTIAPYMYMQTILEGSSFSGIWVDSLGIAYLGSSSNGAVQILTPAGNTSLIVGSSAKTNNSGISAPATSVQLDGVDSIVGDTSGSLYISSGMYFVWKYDRSSGIVSRFAGATPASQSFSGDGGQATAAHLNGPHGMFLSSNGVLFFADAGNNRIRTINTSTGIINTFAGNGAGSYTGDSGPATTASLSNPTSVWGSSDGVIYIADYANNRIRQVDSSGMITTLAGIGKYSYNGDNIPATSAIIVINSINGDSNGNIYFVGTGIKRVRRVKAGIVSTVAGNSKSGDVNKLLISTNSSIPQPKAVFVHSASGAIYYTSAVGVEKIVNSLPTDRPTQRPISVIMQNGSEPSPNPTETPTTPQPSHHPYTRQRLQPHHNPLHHPYNRQSFQHFDLLLRH